MNHSNSSYFHVLTVDGVAINFSVSFFLLYCHMLNLQNNNTQKILVTPSGPLRWPFEKIFFENFESSETLAMRPRAVGGDV